MICKKEVAKEIFIKQSFFVRKNVFGKEKHIQDKNHVRHL